MTTAPNLVIAGDRGLSQKLRNTGRFPVVFDVASATGLRELSKSGRVRSPAAFMFAPDFDEDIPGSGVPHLANGLAASGFTVLVHSFFTERGDLFGPGVIAATAPMNVSDLLVAIGAAEPASLAQPDLQPEPPPEPWASPEATPARPAGRPPERPQPAISDQSPPGPAQSVQSPPGPVQSVQSPPGPVQSDIGDEREPLETPPGYGEPSLVHRGADAVTYCAVHEESGLVVALRVRRDDRQTPPDELAALERASRSEHIATLFDSGRTPTGHAYTASAHCPSPVCAPGEPLLLQDAVGIAVSVGKGLRALHEEGLVHGDVHPGRILRGAEGPMLTGAATLRGLAAHSAPGVLEPVDPERIDPGFAAPEVLLQQPATAASDVYGLGATLWSLLAGHAPFTADERWAVREGASNEAVPRVPRDDVPEWLVNVLANAMANERADRYPMARAFTDALEQGMRDVPAPPAEAFEENPHGVPAPSSYWEGLTGWAWEDTAPEPGDSLGPQEAAYAAAPVTPAAPVARRRSGRRNPVPLALTVLVLVLGVVGIGVASLMAADGAADGAAERRPLADSPQAPAPAKTSRTQSPKADPEHVPTSSPTAVRPVKEYTPGQVRIVDGRVSIEVIWVDRSGGKAAYYVVGGPAGRPPSTLASAPPGAAKVMVSALNPSVDYCLTVVAVVDIDRVAHAQPVCTHRVKRSG
jgi:hypothetical protein